MSSRFVLFGHPVTHSVSPAIHQAAYRELGLSHVYELLDVADEAALVRGMAALRRGEITGANVTVPWKRMAFQLADERHESALGVGAANVLVRGAGGRVIAHNTDVSVLAEEVQRYLAAPRSVAVIGGGGAALAAVRAAQLLGAQAVTVTARRWLANEPRASWPHADGFRALGAELVPWPDAKGDDGEGEFAVSCRRADVIIQATSAGMNGADPGAGVASIVPWSRLPARVLAYDLVYNPPDTDFLRAARAYGLVRSHGLGMLVGQAALAIELWLGAKPPREALHAAAEAALIARRGG